MGLIAQLPLWGEGRDLRSAFGQSQIVPWRSFHFTIGHVHLRTADKDVFPAHWDVAIGGVLAAGESFDDGARREAREELGVAVEVEPLFPLRYEDAHTVVHGVAYRAVHDGPFRLQLEEVVRGEFVPLPALDERTTRERFCPDGLAVLAEYRHRNRS